MCHRSSISQLRVGHSLQPLVKVMSKVQFENLGFVLDVVIIGLHMGLQYWLWFEI